MLPKEIFNLSDGREVITLDSNKYNAGVDLETLTKRDLILLIKDERRHFNAVYKILSAAIYEPQKVCKLMDTTGWPKENDDE